MTPSTPLLVFIEALAPSHPYSCIYVPSYLDYATIEQSYRENNL